MQCPACHTEVGPQSAFCTNCGTPIPPPAAVPPPAYSPAPTPGSGYTEVPSSYTAPAPGYTAPAAGYSQTPPAYTDPAAGYAQTPPAYPPPAAGYTAPPGYAAPPAPAGGATSGGLSPNAAAALAYITIIPAIIFLVIEPYNRIPLVKFHSIQSIGLAVGWFVLWVAVTILQIVLHFIPLIGFLFLLVHLVLGLGIFILWLMTILKASKGEFFKIPVIGDFALKQVQS